MPTGHLAALPRAQPLFFKLISQAIPTHRMVFAAFPSTTAQLATIVPSTAGLLNSSSVSPRLAGAQDGTTRSLQTH